MTRAEERAAAVEGRLLEMIREHYRTYLAEMTTATAVRQVIEQESRQDGVSRRWTRLFLTMNDALDEADDARLRVRALVWALTGWPPA